MQVNNVFGTLRDSHAFQMNETTNSGVSLV